MPLMMNFSPTFLMIMGFMRGLKEAMAKQKPGKLRKGLRPR